MLAILAMKSFSYKYISTCSMYWAGLVLFSWGNIVYSLPSTLLASGLVRDGDGVEKDE